jgi:murein DD-endopeptidase MepM/ murein hydrolase activator NlpD
VLREYGDRENRGEILVHPHHPYHRQRRILAGVLTVICAVAGAVAIGPPAGADPSDDAKRADRAVDRAAAVLEDATTRAQLAATQLAAAMSALPAAQERVAETRGQVASALAAANTARRRADAAEAAYAVVEARFAVAQARVEQARSKVDLVVSATYKGSTFAAINIIAEATGPRDAMDRLGYVGQLMESQQAEVDAFTRARREARTEQDRAGVAQRAADEAERAAVDSLGAAKAAQDAAEQARRTVLLLAANRRAALAVARSERGAVLARYREAKEEEARIVASLRRWEERKGGTATSFTGGSKLMMPVHGWKSSDFGMRLNPVYGVWKLHAGVDIAAGHGSPIRAAADGRVVYAGWSGGYGNYTCISHGRYQGQGLSTCYGHQSEILVGADEQVRRGELIGRVGTTGASTGNHLHFEVRVSGSPHDPLRYLPECLC